MTCFISSGLPSPSPCWASSDRTHCLYNDFANYVQVENVLEVPMHQIVECLIQVHAPLGALWETLACAGDVPCVDIVDEVFKSINVRPDWHGRLERLLVFDLLGELQEHMKDKDRNSALHGGQDWGQRLKMWQLLRDLCRCCVEPNNVPKTTAHKDFFKIPCGCAECTKKKA